MEKFGVSLFGAKRAGGTRNKNREKNIRLRRAQRSERVGDGKHEKKAANAENTRSEIRDKTTQHCSARQNVTWFESSRRARAHKNKQTNQPTNTETNKQPQINNSHTKRRSIRTNFTMTVPMARRFLGGILLALLMGSMDAKEAKSSKLIIPVSNPGTDAIPKNTLEHEHGPP